MTPVPVGDDTPGRLQCPACGLPNAAPVLDDYRNYFEGRPWTCRECATTEDLWSLLLRRLESDSPFSPGIVGAGLADSISLSLELSVDTPIRLDLGIHGLPEGATLIDITFTPTSIAPAFPRLMPAMQLQRLSSRGLPRVMTLHPVDFSSIEETGPIGQTILSIMAIYLPAPPEPEIESLFTATRAFASRDYRGSIVPAQVAVEAKLKQVMTRHFRQHGSRKDVESFLKNGAVYGHQLRFLLPALAAATGAPGLTSDVKAALQALRGRRNELSHDSLATGRDEAAMMLLAAMFGYQYLVAFGETLAPTKV